MAEPSTLPYWATNDETDPEFGTPNKAQPSSSKQQFGQRGKENTLRQDINWLFNSIREWLEFLRNRYAVGDVYGIEATAFDNLGPDDNSRLLAAADQLGGTWDWINTDKANSTDTLATVSTVFIEKTG